MVIARWVHKQTKRFIWGYSQSKLNVLHCMRTSVFRCMRYLFIIRNAPCSKRKTDAFCSIGYWKLVITVPAVASETIRWHGVHSSHHIIVSAILCFQSQTLNTDPSFSYTACSLSHCELWFHTPGHWRLYLVIPIYSRCLLLSFYVSVLLLAVSSVLAVLHRRNWN